MQLEKKVLFFKFIKYTLYTNGYKEKKLKTKRRQ